MASSTRTLFKSRFQDTDRPGEPLGAQYIGGDADETITGTDENDYLHGGGGNDIIAPLLAVTRDESYGGDGFDTLILDYSASLTAVRHVTVEVTSPGGTSIFHWIRADSSGFGDTYASQFATLYGDIERLIVTGSATAGNSLRGGAADDYLTGGTGSDTLYSFGDAVAGGSESYSGNDTIDIGKAASTAAETGADIVQMGAGGTDHLIVDWSAATEVVSFGFTSYTGTGDYYNSNGTTIGGLARLNYSGVEDFTVRTGSANDSIRTGMGSDMIDGGAGNDAIDSGAGQVDVDGEAGLDSWAAHYGETSAAIVLNVNAAGTQMVGDHGTMTAIEGFGVGSTAFISGTGDDILETLIGGAVADRIDTGAGNDMVWLYGGTDAASTAADVVTLGTGGDDRLVVDWSSLTQAVSFGFTSYTGEGDYYNSNGTTISGLSKLNYSGVEHFTVKTGSAADSIRTGQGDDTIDGGSGDDLIDTGAGIATLVGGDGVDRWAADMSLVGVGLTVNLNLAGPQSLGDGSAIVGVEGLGVASTAFFTGSGNDTITTLASGAVEDRIDTGTGNDTVTLYAGASATLTGADVVTLGTAGDDHLIVDWSATTEIVSFGFTSYTSGVGDYYNSNGTTIGGFARLNYSGVERFTVKTGSAGDNIRTGSGNDRIEAGAGNDSIDTGAGTAILLGGDGVDRWAADLSLATASLTIDLNKATPQNLGDGSTIVGIEGLGVASTAFITGSGNDTIRTLASGAVEDRIDSGTGNDTVTLHAGVSAALTGADVVTLGAAGDDHLIVDWSAATEIVSFGFTSHNGTGDYYNSNGTTIGGLAKLNYSGVERFTVKTGSAADTITTGMRTDAISAGAGDDVIDSGAGRATIDGGIGSDSWAADFSAATHAIAINLNIASVQSIGDGSSIAGIDGLGTAASIFRTGSGNDIVKTLASGAIADRIDTGTGSDSVTVYGGQTFAFTGRDSVAMGAGGTDHLIVDWSDTSEAVSFGFTSYSGTGDYYSAGVTMGGYVALTYTGVERFTIRTGAADDNVTTGNGDDTIESGGGNDVLNGGAGADQFAGGAGDDRYILDDAGDKVIEAADEGSDTVESSVSYSIAGQYVEILKLTGSGIINATGNNQANTITGNGAANVLNGAGGADAMSGGGGNDRYIVDDAGDTIVELAGGGTDRVESKVTFVLGDNLENLTLTGTTSIHGTGNGLANTIIGNSAGNIIDGLAGADTMEGGAGNDRYIVDNAADTVLELADAGTDTVESSVTFSLAGQYIETLRLTGAAAINGTGNGQANSIYGNVAANAINAGGGNDKLYGGAGSDILTGGAGLDRFTFDSALDAATNVDKIVDFSVADDGIYLNRSVFSGLASGTVSAAAFVNGTAALDAGDRILYDKASGNIFYDADGTGAAAAVLFTTVTAGTVLTNADFIGF